MGVVEKDSHAFPIADWNWYAEIAFRNALAARELVNDPQGNRNKLNNKKIWRFFVHDLFHSYSLSWT